MSTRCRIGKLNEDGTVTSIYCHFDGYSGGVGRILYEYYTSIEDTDSLIALGDISYLGKRVNPIGDHSFENPEKDTTVAYGRDRGDSEVGARVDKSVNEYLDNRNDWDIDYKYLGKPVDNKIYWLIYHNVN